MAQSTRHLHHLQTPERNKPLTVVEALPAKDGMTVDAPIQPRLAITSTFVPNAQTEAMSQANAILTLKNKVLSPALRWERRPRFVRDYVWPVDVSSPLSTALMTETAPPVPRPPQNELFNQLALSTIQSHPHLFKITTPININRFGSLLTSHPNRPLVDSVCTGLEFGFWPWATTNGSDGPEIVNNAVLQKIRNLDHLAFMRHQRDEEILLGRFSTPFQDLLPGMTTIPLWVVPKPHSDKLRLVVDQSAGEYSPNSFISPSDASVHLDTLHALGAALIRVRKQHGDVPLVLFKTDVSQAYRRLPMHPLWQIRQIVTIDDMNHVDRNNNFGNRGAGRLWVTFFGLVLWIAGFVVFIHDLFAYVDDAFSYEFADRMTFYGPYNKYMPTKQSRLLTLFDDLGIPHEEQKQVFGSPLTIIGFDVNPNSMTITMSPEARNDLIGTIRDFPTHHVANHLKTSSILPVGLIGH